VDAKAQLLVHVSHPAAPGAADRAADGSGGHAAAADGSYNADSGGASDRGDASGGGARVSDSAAAFQGMDDGEGAAALQAALEGACSPDLEVIAASRRLLSAARCCMYTT
jgi:hypothetical protein